MSRARQGSVASGRYDDWKATNRDDPGASVNVTPPTHETCEKCGGTVSGVSVSWCEKGQHYSHWPSRPERNKTPGPTLDERLKAAGFTK